MRFGQTLNRWCNIEAPEKSQKKSVNGFYQHSAEVGLILKGICWWKMILGKVLVGSFSKRR